MDWVRDFRFAVRQMVQHPAFTAIAVLTLALGIGANTAIFSVVHAALLRALPYPEGDRLVMVWEQNFPRNRTHNVVAPVNYAEWKRRAGVFEGLAAFAGGGATLTGAGGPERIRGTFVTPDFWNVLEIEPALGRAFLPEEGKPGAADVVILSHGLWQRRFGGDPAIVGSTIALDGEPHVVVGILPARFVPVHFQPGSEAPEFYAPLVLGSALETYGGRWIGVVGRLKPGVTAERAQADMSAIAAELEAAHDYNKGWGANVVPLRDHQVGHVRLALLVLLAAVGFILLIACANVGSLLLARAAARRREIAVRSALGAGRVRLIRQLLVEGLPLALLGGAVGLILAVWGVEALRALAPPELADLADAPVQAPVLAFTLGVSLIVALLAGIAPAVYGTRADLRGSLQDGGSRATDGPGRRVRGAFVIAEVALAIVLTIGAGLLVKSFTGLRAVDPGFDADRALTARIALPEARYPEATQQVAFSHELLAEIRAVPGVVAAAVTTTRPLDAPGIGTSFSVEGMPEPEPSERPVADIWIISEGYFQAMTIPLVVGRVFGSEDRAGAPAGVVINETLARTFWPGESALGREVSVNLDTAYVGRVVGVVGDLRHQGLDVEPRPMIYFLDRQAPDPVEWMGLHLVVRTATDPEALLAPVRETVRRLDPEIPVYGVATLRELVSRSVRRERFGAALLGGFAALALALATVGLYGVVAYSVAQRTGEIGVRVALGAARYDVLTLVLRQTLALVVLGLAAGVLGALALTRLMSGLLHEVSAFDPAVYLGVGMLFTVVAVLASLVPARRAMNVDPLTALRYE